MANVTFTPSLFTFIFSLFLLTSSLLHIHIKGLPRHIYAALGDGGNVIYVNAKKKMVVSIASLYMPRAKDRIKLIKEYIEPMFED